MRILVVGLKNWLGAWTEATAFALKDMGHTVHTFYYQDRTYNLKYRIVRKLNWLACQAGFQLVNRPKRVQERLIAEARDFNPDLVLVLKGEMIEKTTLEVIKGRNALIATWWVDAPPFLGEAAKTHSIYDAFFVFDETYVPGLTELGISHVDFLPNAYAANVFYPMHLTESEKEFYTCDVAFVGSGYAPREEMFKELEGRKIAIWGPGWDKRPEVREYIDVGKAWRGRVLPVHEAAKLYNAAAICLNHHHHQIAFNGLNMRAFEIPACGSLQVVDYRDGFEDFFTPNREIVYYRSFDEIGSLVEYYLSHPVERKEIAQQGYERVVQEHSYHHRMEKIVGWATTQLEVGPHK